MQQIKLLEVNVIDKLPRSPIERFKLQNNYRKSEDGRTSCAVCRFSVWKNFETGSGKKQKLKCKYIGVTCSSKTDISRFHVCALFELFST